LVELVPRMPLVRTECFAELLFSNLRLWHSYVFPFSSEYRFRHGVECLDENDTIGLVRSINLTSNQLYGTLPPEIALLGLDLRILDISHNSIGGSFPELASLENLQHLYIGPNDFMAGIPNSLYELSHLTHLYMNDCVFTGTVSSRISNLSLLQGLAIENNLLRGRIPEQIGYLSNLRVLYADGNVLTGNLPNSIPSSLVDLRLGNNKLQGIIPSTIANARYLQILYLNDNELEGKAYSSTTADEVNSVL